METLTSQSQDVAEKLANQPPAPYVMKLGIVPLAAFYQSEIDHSQNDQFHRDMPPGLSGPEKAFYIQARRQALLGKGALDQF